MSWLNDQSPDGTLAADDISRFGVIAACQAKIAAMLPLWSALAPLADKPHCITWKDKGTVADDVNQAMKTLGLSIMVIFRGGSRKSAYKNAVMLNPAKFEISILEMPKLNRGATGTKISATQVMAEIVKALAGQRLANGQICVGDVATPDDLDGAQHIVIPIETALLISDTSLPTS